MHIQSSLKVRFLMWIYLLCLFVGVSHSIEISEDKITLMECYNMLQENKSAIEAQSPLEPKCETDGCVKVAAQFVNYIDVSIDPCDNFYQFANGHYINDESDDTGDNESRGFYNTVTKKVHLKVGALLNEPMKPDEFKPIELAKNFYKSCISKHNSDSKTKLSLRSLGIWPVLQGKSWQSRDFNLFSIMKKVAELGFGTDIIFGLDYTLDQQNSTNKLLQISSGTYVITEAISDFDNAKAIAKYRNIMLETAVRFADKVDKATRARMRDELTKVVAFELKLLKNHVAAAAAAYMETDDIDDDMVDIDDIDDIDNIIDIDDINEIDEIDDIDDDIDNDIDDDKVIVTISTIKELQQSYPYLNWLEFINLMLPSGLNVTENEPIRNLHPHYFEKLGNVLKTTSNRTIANYILWRVVNKFFDLYTLPKDDDFRKKCIDLTIEKFPIPVGILYSQKYFKEQSRQAVIDLVEDMRGSFIDMLRNVTWMDDNTRETAIAKAKNIVAHVGYPNELYAEISEYYEGLEIEPDDFLYNFLQIESFKLNQKLKSLRKPLSRSSGWEILLELDPTTANAFYIPSLNIMEFPVAILHELFFDVDRPQYVNYASLGNTVGHEITHGFDDNGRKYDLTGNLINWWNTESKKEFTRKANCFIKQYNNYTDPKTHKMISGKKTLNENIADNGGTRAAYYAYLNHIERNGDEKLVTGQHKFNQKQLFWISYAQAESAVSGINYLAYVIENDEHAPAEYRVNGVVSNLEEFASDFNCPVATKMNPAEKCRIW